MWDPMYSPPPTPTPPPALPPVRENLTIPLPLHSWATLLPLLHRHPSDLTHFTLSELTSALLFFRAQLLQLRDRNLELVRRLIRLPRARMFKGGWMWVNISERWKGGIEGLDSRLREGGGESWSEGKEKVEGDASGGCYWFLEWLTVERVGRLEEEGREVEGMEKRGEGSGRRGEKVMEKARSWVFVTAIAVEECKAWIGALEREERWAMGSEGEVCGGGMKA
ncbi:hypothetical protein K432DRAFT_426837 [Lepidopterella palustris CBS 459.81]|uniref:Uncharacterized protein n=1 Tax=Lepidopterella palustris CBS 459.81 TaxID=1314670 RepID=A0A8E2E7W9_9PEZI|nr:hypothetical protein K432DRAFT_426837 [Lepidopterella palustris CBS 459.81]